MIEAAKKCPVDHESVPSPESAPATESKKYRMNGGPKGWPVAGVIKDAIQNPLGLLLRNSMQYGDIIPNKMMGMTMLQINHPDLIYYISVENHKNYHKSINYVRFAAAVGNGLLISNGEKWKRDRQKIQPMFKREQIEGYYFDVANEVAEKFKRRWLKLTEKGPAQINLTYEMAAITTEIIVKLIFGKDNLDDEAVVSLHHSFSVMMDYLKELRLIPTVDFRKLFHMPSHTRFKKELTNVENILSRLSEKYRREAAPDKYNMLALLIEAQKEDPEHFNEQDIRDQSIQMVFAGFETTSIVLQWYWYALDTRPDIRDKVRADITSCSPCSGKLDSSAISYDELSNMNYLFATIKETMRLYPPFWAVSRAPVEDDMLGDFHVKAGTEIVLPQIVMHRHPQWWDEPNAFIPERFFPENERKIRPGLYFPFALGSRGCVGSKLGEMEARVIVTKLLPLFKIKILNAVDNNFDPGISLKLERPLQAEISRL